MVFSSYLLLDPVWSHELNKRFVADYEDTHGQHCVNISEYTEPVWVDDEVECCEKKTKKMCFNHTAHRQVYTRYAITDELGEGRVQPFYSIARVFVFTR